VEAVEYPPKNFNRTKKKKFRASTASSFYTLSSTASSILLHYRYTTVLAVLDVQKLIKALKLRWSLPHGRKFGNSQKFHGSEFPKFTFGHP
jgi:hypothetical protein